nr:hypothetical protein [Tessaracoccus coleopterorum]
MANGIPVNNGAGQYRAVGRMLTLPRLGALHETMVTAQARAVAPNAWGDVPRREQTSNVIIPLSSVPWRAALVHRCSWTCAASSGRSQA